MLLLLCGLAVVACAGCSRGDASGVDEVVVARVSQVRSAARAAGLPAPVVSVMASAAGAPAATFSAVYASGDASGTVVVHQRPPRRRVDVVDGSGRTVSSFVVEGDGSAVRCTRQESEWECAAADVDGAEPMGAFDPAVLDAAVAALAEASTPVTVERTTIAGAAARCVRSGPADRFCVSSAGVPLLVERSDGAAPLRATSYRASVTDDELRRPDR